MNIRYFDYKNYEIIKYNVNENFTVVRIFNVFVQI